MSAPACLTCFLGHHIFAHYYKTLVPGPAPAESTPAQQARSLEGRPLGRLPSGDIALNSFEGSRLESLIRTLSEERAPA